MKLAKVVAVHPESHSVDLLVMDDGRRLPGVQVMSPFASSSHGLAGLARPKSQDLPDPYSAPFDGKRDIIACVGFYRDAPIVMGFLFPQVSQVLFSDYDRVMDRSPSDAYWTIDKDGNSEYFHPSGTYIRVAVNPEHEDLTGKDADKIWKIERNTDKAVHLHMEVQQAGERKVSLDLAPDGAAVVDAIKSVLLKAPLVTIDSPETEITGHVTVGNGVTVKGDVTADDISLKNHPHGGVLRGGAKTDKPLPG